MAHLKKEKKKEEEGEDNFQLIALNQAGFSDCLYQAAHLLH